MGCQAANGRTRVLLVVTIDKNKQYAQFGVLTCFFFTDLLFVVPKVTMTDTTTAATLTRLFKGPDARLGKKWTDSVDEGWTDAALHRVVLAKGTLNASKSKEMYGHYRTKTQMRGLEGPYWNADAAVIVASEIRRLNTTPLDVPTRLKQLRTENIGGLLVVTKVADSTGKSIPFLTLLAAPSVATLQSYYWRYWGGRGAE